MGASATYGIPMLGARTRIGFSCKFFRVDEVQDCMNLRSYHYVSQDALRVVAWTACFATPISFFCCADMCTMSQKAHLRLLNYRTVKSRKEHLTCVSATNVDGG